MEIDGDLNEAGGEFVMYLEPKDLQDIFLDQIVTDSTYISDTNQMIDLTVTLDSGTFERENEKQHYDDVMEALEEIYRAFLVSEGSTTVKELKNKNTVDIEKALETYIHYNSIRRKYK